MKPLLVVLVAAVSVYGQSVADVARQERERQARLKSTYVFTLTESPNVDVPKLPAPPADQAADVKPLDPAAAPAETSKEPAKPQTPTAVDPVQVWNNQLDQLRTRIRTLQDQEMSLLLQLNLANNQVYAPVTDPATQQRALALVGQIQEQVAVVRKDLEEARRSLDSLQLQGPPKK